MIAVDTNIIVYAPLRLASPGRRIKEKTHCARLPELIRKLGEFQPSVRRNQCSHEGSGFLGSGNDRRANAFSPSAKMETRMKRILCGDLIPGCDFKAQAATDSEVLAVEMDHVRAVHGIDITPPFLQRARERIMEAEAEPAADSSRARGAARRG